MIDDFSWQLSLYSERQSPITICQKDSNQQNPQLSLVPQKSVATSFSDEATILINSYGDFYPGKIISMDLDSACKLLGRTRHRVDAFARLQKYLMKEYQTELKITSRKTH